SVGHVEVFRMGSVRTSIIGRPRPLSGNRRANAIYTLDSDEPEMCLAACQTIQPGLAGDTIKQMKKLKGSSGTFLARALIDRHADWHSWPTPLRELIQKIDVAI
ncbi:hypothetical protein, partial [Arthrobacter sp. CAU 1506]|uniref:hypothetical protein n=1 Tax=Arthrobacter sp. CAU 1506 TaxID=2560052 RepID=UPI00197A763A